MLGLRYTFLHEPARQLLHEGHYEWLWSAAQEFDIPIAMLATDSLEYLAGVAQRHPGLRLTIDHLGGRGGTTTLKDDQAMTHMPKLLSLARFENIAVKVTGAPGYSSGPYPFGSMHDYLQQIFDAFGPERTFWGQTSQKCPVVGDSVSVCLRSVCRGSQAPICRQSWERQSENGGAGPSLRWVHGDEPGLCLHVHFYLMTISQFH